MRVLWLMALYALAWCRSAALCADLPVCDARVYQAADSLQIGAESSADARECLEGLAWQPAAFEVRCEAADGLQCDALVRFPSPVVTGNAVNDQVTLEWYAARDETQRPRIARAFVVVHESGSQMTVGRIVANELHRRGLHAFLINLPHYGQRRSGARPGKETVLTVMRQAVADVRRARDAVAALPLVDSSHIALQGTSLGGFVAASSASLDSKFDSVFLMLAGGDLCDLLQSGQQDTANARRELEEAGISGDRLRALTQTIEPTRIGHRLDPQTTWLYSGTLDRVVPMKNALALARAARLDEQHHVRFLADHYSGILYLPKILDEMAERVRDAKEKSLPVPPASD